MLILRKFKRHLTREDFLSFNLGANLDDYKLPGLNLIFKVHKLTEKAGVKMDLCWARFSLPKLRNDLGGIFVFPMVYSKGDNEVYTEEKVLRRAGAGLPLLIPFSILRKVNSTT